MTLDNLGREVPTGDDGKNVYAKLIVDGINHPLAAGAFLDLCKKGFYDGTGIRRDKFMFSASRGELSNSDGEMGVERKLLGCRENADPDDGYIDKSKKLKRRFPIEVLRQKTKTPVGSSRSNGKGRDRDRDRDRDRGNGDANSNGGDTRYTGVGVRYGGGRGAKQRCLHRTPVPCFPLPPSAIGMWHSQNELSSASAAFFSIASTLRKA